MGQYEIMEVLRKNKGWMITGEIASILDQDRSLINRSLRKLFKEGIVMRKEVPTRRKRGYLWKHKD